MENPLHLAQSRLRIAQRAHQSLSESTNFDEFSDHWYVFLQGFHGVFTVFKEAEPPSKKAENWLGRKNAERRRDPLLQYLYEARNDEEHGLARSVVLSGGQHLYKVTPGQHILGPDPSKGRWFACDADTGIPLELVVWQGPGPMLGDVRNRDKAKIYGAPIVHRRKTLTDLSPIAVGELGLTWLRAMIEEAATRFA
jgi:hypothetical protein